MLKELELYQNLEFAAYQDWLIKQLDMTYEVEETLRYKKEEAA